MRTLFHPMFMAAVVLAAGNQLLEHNGIFIPYVHAYLDDLVCFPIVLSIGLAAYRVILGNAHYVMGHWQVWPAVALYALVFELVLPMHSTIYTADPLDVLAYAIGAAAFMRWINQ
jgi:hypothetical protein